MIFRIKIRVVTKAKKNEIIKEQAGGWKIRVTDPPSKGKANEKMIELLADEFKVAKSNVSIIQGLTARDKVVEIVM